MASSDTASLDLNRVLGFCTAIGGASAHTAILARALGLPAIVGASSGVLKLENRTSATEVRRTVDSLSLRTFSKTKSVEA